MREDASQVPEQPNADVQQISGHFWCLTFTCLISQTYRNMKKEIVLFMGEPKQMICCGTGVPTLPLQHSCATHCQQAEQDKHCKLCSCGHWHFITARQHLVLQLHLVQELLPLLTGLLLTYHTKSLQQLQTQPPTSAQHLGHTCDQVSSGNYEEGVSIVQAAS